jgi:hypothetical protein
MPVIYAPIGRCIYCGATEYPIDDEHIIPLGLGGYDILPNASCRACSKITGKFEGVVQRTIYGDFRVRNRLPTRRKRDRPNIKTINAVTPEGVKKIEVPSVEFPAVYWVYTFGTCGFLLSAPPGLDVSNSNLATIHNNEELAAFTNKYNWDKTISAKFMPNEFRRMIAKIGYCTAVAIAGLENFKPLIIDAILNPAANISYFVGQEQKYKPIVEGGWHETALTVMHAPDGRMFLFANVRLFSSAGTPTYHVLVGEIEGAEQHARMAEKFRDRGDYRWRSPSPNESQAL